MTHIQSRAQERFGITLDKRLRKHVASLITQGKSMFIRHEPLRHRSLHQVTIKGQEMVVVYDKQTKELVTCFHPPSPWLSLEELENALERLKRLTYRMFHVDGIWER